jgi:predicted enzyme related to lactoylglutathione lyase
MIKGFATVWCYVTDMDRAVVFYRDVLGLEVGMVSPYWSQFKVGSNLLGLHPVGDPTGPTGDYGRGWHLGIEVDDIRALREKLVNAGVAIKGDYHDVPGAVVLDFVDPDGNTLEAYQPGIKAASLA